MRLTVIIPVYNEIQTIREILQRVQASGFAQEILVVDDGSTDGSRDVLRQMDGQEGIRVVFHERNQGKGAAVVTGIRQAGGDVLLIQDADLEYTPDDYPLLLRPLEEGRADVVYGSRFLDGKVTAYPLQALANRMLTWMTNLLYGDALTDMETGYKVFRSQVAQGMVIRARGFEFEPEFTAKLLKRKVRICEVPIHFAPRDYRSGKKIGLHDAFVAVWTLVKYRFVE